MTWTYALDALPDLPLDDVKALVGGKAANLGVMIRQLGLPVPPGFAITTAACRDYLAGSWPVGLDDEIRARMAEVEAAVGRRFGDPADPLLVSVRSGAPVSMPGMMDTILDLGLNDATTAGLARATGDDAFAQACRKRFEAGFRDIVGVDAPPDRWVQLRLAVEAVFRSWDGDRAKAYRRKEGIADDLGTGVTVQAMVFGNRGPTSGTGVLFTRDPATGAPTPYGDILFDAQGEDVVAGTHPTEPISAIDERLPSVAAELGAAASTLERYYADLCDIEFTIQDGRLWLLQVRIGKRTPQAALRIAVDMAEDRTFPLTRAGAVRRVAPILAHPPTQTRVSSAANMPLAVGLGASPGIASGPIATDPEAAITSADAGQPAILVRAETSPDDVHGMARAAGILTSTGGLASHAAVVARGWGIPAVVGTLAVEVGDGQVVVGGRAMRSGDLLTIDGGTGEVFEGALAVTSTTAPEVEILFAWAHELGIPIDADKTLGAESSDATGPEVERFAASSDARVTRGAEHGADTPGPSDLGPEPAITSDACLLVIAIKGFATTEAVAEALLSTPDALRPTLDQLAAGGLVSTVAGAYGVTEAGTDRADGLRRAEQASWGIDQANAALDAFLDLDQRVKDTVTAWQLRDGPEGQVPNDHDDAAYDAAVLERLVSTHQDAMAWLVSIAQGCPRLSTYGRRLTRALDLAADGDGRYVASPRVDSYHGVWFELHEDLIGLAGRTRADEVAAGRA